MHSTLSRVALKLHERVTGRNILTRLEELNRTQWLNRDELLLLQRGKLIRVLEYANRYVPYYQRIFREVGFNLEDIHRDLSRFYNIPILTKETIKRNFAELQTTEPKRRNQLSKLSTSGSTGEPLIFLQDHNFRDFVTADIQRHLSWAGLGVGDLHALIWGGSFNPSKSKKIRTKLIDMIWNRFQINAFTLTDQSMAGFAERIIRQKPLILFGYATSIYRFAQFVRQNAYYGIKFTGVFTSAETLLKPMRDVIEETFSCRVFNRYASLELGGIASECEGHNGMHISEENNFVEIMNNGSSAKPGELGDLIITNLNNLGMPFIRYYIGDNASWSTDGKCACKRESVKISSLEGRIVDTFLTPDGRIVWSGFAGAAFRCLAHSSIREFQVVQKSLDRIVIRLVSCGEIPPVILQEIQNAVWMVFGEGIFVDFEFPQAITPMPSGKHSYAISELNQN